MIVKLCGGLGNQMYQYAFAKALQHIYDVDVSLDISWFANGGGNLTRYAILN